MVGKLAYNTVVNAFVKDKVAIGIYLLGIDILFAQMLAWSFENHFSIIGRDNGCMGIHADSSIKYGTAINVGIG